MSKTWSKRKNMAIWITAIKIVFTFFEVNIFGHLQREIDRQKRIIIDGQCMHNIYCR